ncbi:MAG: pyruvate dehydrogenase (acetyl-transferring), homodimeric type [Proteobacteria bacterium]|nr:pyruvate dehydrogenase (acetyl-transferring), homodimeric type [Pseudomonadota bacterium]
MLKKPTDRPHVEINNRDHYSPDLDPVETREWLQSFDEVVQREGVGRAHFLLSQLLQRAHLEGVPQPALFQTPYVNTIPPQDEGAYPGDETMERRIRRIIRWNAVAMVLRGNNHFPGIGGHLSTYASAASLYEVGFQHFFRGKDHPGGGDQIFFQGHASPGIYARAFLEGRLDLDHLERFRREVERGKGLSSYPHPWLMPDFWEFPTVSMGLGPITGIYQARFNRYLQARGIKDTSDQRVWCFLGDGETDEPEALGALSIAAREQLDNLVFVINCNLQRLDGPVRGNGKIIQELETVFRGAGWNVIKLVWGREWDQLLARDDQGLLVKTMTETLDGDYQKYSVEHGDYIRSHFFAKHPELLKMVEHLSDEELRRLRRGGHDIRKIYAAYKAACEHKGAPTVILAKTVKGWTLGEGAEGRNIAHQQKKLSLKELLAFRDLLQLPISDSDLPDAPFYRPNPNSPEIEYLLERRRQLGGFVPKRVAKHFVMEMPTLESFDRYLKGTDQPVSTTSAFAGLLAHLLRLPEIGRRIVPIIPDEARTFGLDALFRQYGIYSCKGQLYESVDQQMLLSYREAEDGQVIEEGITEAGSMASFTAAGTSYATHGEPMIPFYIFYSMFGFQRTGDQAWLFGDIRGRGFLLGATAGRTTLNGEGLQHGDGHSHLLASVVPNVRAYDPAWAYEIAIIIQDGLKRMYMENEDTWYYVTLQNEPYAMPPIPREDVVDGVLRGLYLFREARTDLKKGAPKAQLLGSGSILREVLRAQEILADRYNVAADVWSATSYLALRRDAMHADREHMFAPEQPRRVPYVTSLLEKTEGPIIAASDYIRAVPDQIARWTPRPLYSLGTDGFGRSDTREALRRFFEVDAESVVLATLVQLSHEGRFKAADLKKAMRDLGFDESKPHPVHF